MTLRVRHPTGSAKPGEPNDRPRAPAPPPPPRWRMWLLPLGLIITLLSLSLVHSSSGPPTKNFSYSKFLSQVEAGDVRTASINPGGAITGTLKGGDDYTSQIPTAIVDTQLAPTLKAHNVDVTGVGQGSALLADILSFLPLRVVRCVLHLDRPQERQTTRRGNHGLRRVRRPRSMTRTARPRGSRTSRATRGRSARCPRWWTS